MTRTQFDDYGVVGRDILYILLLWNNDAYA